MRTNGRDRRRFDGRRRGDADVDSAAACVVSPRQALGLRTCESINPSSVRYDVGHAPERALAPDDPRNRVLDGHNQARRPRRHSSSSPRGNGGGSRARPPVRAVVAVVGEERGQGAVCVHNVCARRASCARSPPSITLRTSALGVPLLPSLPPARLQWPRADVAPHFRDSIEVSQARTHTHTHACARECPSIESRASPSTHLVRESKHARARESSARVWNRSSSIGIHGRASARLVAPPLPRASATTHERRARSSRSLCLPLAPTRRCPRQA